MPTQPEKPNLDLIRLVQQARMAHDREAQPSSVSAVYWIESKPLKPAAPPTPRAGEYIIETTLAEVDALWGKIRTATEAGELGYKSKVSTSPAKGQTSSEARVIVVRTADADDTADVARVETVLKALGITPQRYERITPDE
ncbi:MAG: DUF1917 domain-containing protein [Anaerolineae bacterium]